VDKEETGTSRADQALLLLSVLAFLGTSSAWVRVSAIQIRGLDYAFGFLPAFAALFVGWQSLSVSLGKSTSLESKQNAFRISIALSTLSLILICAIGLKVRQISRDFETKAVEEGSIWSRAFFRLLNSALSLPSNSIQKSITPKFAEGFFISLSSFVLILVILVAKKRPSIMDEESTPH
jgi:hypothetical protein